MVGVGRKTAWNYEEQLDMLRRPLVITISATSNGSNAQWEFGRPTLNPINLEDKSKVKVE